MSAVQLHYDGWLTLPAAVRQKLHLTTGDRFEVELTSDAVVLRPVRPASAPEPERAASAGAAAAEEAQPPAVTTPEPAPSAPTPIPTPAPAAVVKKGPGRPRKTPPRAAALPPSLKGRGGRRKTAPPAVEAPPR